MYSIWILFGATKLRSMCSASCSNTKLITHVLQMHERSLITRGQKPEVKLHKRKTLGKPSGYVINGNGVLCNSEIVKSTKQ